MKTKTTATKKKAAANKKKSTNKTQVAVARAMPEHVPTTNASNIVQLQQRLAYIQQLEQLDQSNAQLRQMMNAQIASQQQMSNSSNRNSGGVVLPNSTPSQLQHLQQQVVAAQINQVNNRKDMIHQIDKEIRAKIPSVQEKKKKSSSSSEDKVEKVVIKAEQLFHLTVSPGRLGLTIAMNPNGGATITVIDPICTFASKINVGDRIVTIDGKDVLTLEDIKNGKDRARTFGIMQKVKESTVQKGLKEMEIAAKMAKSAKDTSLTAAAAAEIAEMSKDIVALSATQAEKKSQPVTQVDKKTADTSTTVTGKKKTKKQKDPNKPKGFKNAYNFCMADARPIVKAANPELSFREMPKKLGEYWQALSKEERMPYEKMAAADKERYDREMAVYNAKKDGAGDSKVANKSIDTSEPQEGNKKRKREVVDNSDDEAVGTNVSEEVVEEGNANKRLKHEGFFTRVFNKIKGIFS